MKKIFLVSILLLTIGKFAFSQRASDARKQRLEQEKIEKLFDATDADFKISDVPTEFQKESAVILSQKKEYSFYKEGNVSYAKELVRKRIKLQDKASLENFSTMYFYKDNEINYNAKDIDIGLGIFIEKSDGSRIKVETKDAVKVEGTLNVPDYYRALLNYSWHYYKIAVPNLEINDIIDYVSEAKKVTLSVGGHAYPAMIFTLNDKYPIVKQKFVFNTERGFFLNCNTFNGAPQLQKVETGDRKQYKYILTDSNRPRIKGTYWFYKYRVLPTLKFQVFNAQIGKSTPYFIGQKDEPKKTITQAEIATKVSEKILFRDYITTAIVNEVSSNVNKKLTGMEYVKSAYYYLRYAIIEKKYIGYNSLSSINDEYFCKIMAAIMDDKKIKYDVIITSAKEISNLSDVISSDEFIWMLKTGDTYISNFMYGSNFGDLNYHTLGAEAIAIAPHRREELVKFVKLTLPKGNSNDNNAQINHYVKINDDFEQLKIQRKNIVKGYLKEAFAEEALTYTDYSKNDYKFYGGEAPKDETLETRNKTKIAEIERKRKEEKDERIKNKKEFMKEALEKEYPGLKTFEEFSLVSDGRLHSSPVLEYVEDFTVGDLLQKVGNNYMLQVGAVIGKHNTVDGDDRERNYDIFMAYPRSLNYTITLDIPSGYTIEGIDALKFNIDSEVATFTSIPEVKDGKLNIQIKRAYKNDFFKKEDWKKVVAVLDAGFDFTQKKILLKKQ